MRVTLKTNGKPATADVETRSLLVDVLRDKLGLTGTKVGCETGECGACTVLIDGKAAKSCLILAVQAEGASVTTVEGLATGGQLSPLQQAFFEHHASQTDYPTGGMLMALTELLRRNPTPSEKEIRAWLGGNISRVTGYENIVRAVQAVAGAETAGGAPVSPAGPEPSGIGASVKAKEQLSVLRGETRFVADMTLAGMLHVAILRSPHGHARLDRIDTSRAAAMPGVVRVFTGADTAHLMPLPLVWVPKDVPSHWPPHPSGVVPGSQRVMAIDRVRFIGEQIAAVVAETPEQAHDALAAIVVDYTVQPAVVDAEEALKPGAPQLHDEVPGNLALKGSYGNKEATDQAIEEAEVVVRQRIHNQRLSANPIEPRGVLACFDADTAEYTLWTNSQPLHPLRLLIAAYVLGIPYNRLRAIAPSFGESLGCKGFLYADAPLLLFIAKALGRPVKWVDRRSGLARSTVQGRDHVGYGTLAGTKDGRITALRCIAVSNIGAYPVINAPSQPRTLIGRSLPGPYVIPQSYYEVSIAFTNTVQVGALRGSGRAEATFLTERLIDMYARQIGMDPVEVRRKNLVPADRFPYDNGLGWTYDSGNYPVALDQALAKIDYPHLDDRRAEARRRGKRLGVGVACYVAVAGVGPSSQMQAEGLVSGTWGSASIRVHPGGEVTVTTGAQPHGQSQETTFSQIVSEELGVPMEMIRILHSDTNGALLFAQGSYGSRSLSVEGTAVMLAARKVKDKARRYAAHLFQMPEDLVVYEHGRVYGKPAPDKAVMTLQQVAFTIWLAVNLPPGMEPGLEAQAYFDPPNFNFPFGTHVALVEVDEKTGGVEIVRYVAVDDCGNVVNPRVVDGQTHGNIALGIGQALFEEVVYDRAGQILTDDFSHYALPRAADLPAFEVERTVTPSPINPLGAKGAGDTSNPPVAPAVVNAVCDALTDLNIKHIEMPLRPERVWRAIQGARAAVQEAREP